MPLFTANWKTHEAVARSSYAHKRSSKALTKLKAALSSKGSSFSRQRSTSKISDSGFSVTSLQDKICLEMDQRRKNLEKEEKSDCDSIEN